MKKKVVIIGAGPAGLTAGYELLNKSKDYKVVILEESNNIGGISKTINYKGNRMDLGGHRFFSKDPDVIKFWNNILPLQGSPSFDDKKLNRKKNISKEGPDPEVEDNVMLVRNRVSRIYYLKKFFDYPLSLKLQTFTNMGVIKTIKSGFSYIKSMVIKKKEDSLENFYINRFGKQLYEMFFKKYTENLWGRHPSEISADWGKQRVKGLSIWEVIKDMFHINKTKETSLIEEYIYPKYGPGQLWENVANEITNKGSVIKLNHQVIKINTNGKKIESVICNVNGKKKLIKGDIFISSMPLKDLVLDLDCNIPSNIKNIANGLPYRDFVTVGLLVKKLNLKNTTKIKTLNNIVPDCWIYVQEPDVKLGRIQIFNNWSPYMVKKPEETVWLGLEYFCNENDEFWNMTDKECIKFATEELIHMGIINKEDVIDAHREKVKKAYPAYFDTYKNINKVINYVNKFDNLYCVGRNGQHRYNNMDHSMITSFETVKNILTNKKNKDNIWNVNTEKEYHEKKVSNKNNKDSNKNIKNNYFLYALFLIIFELCIYIVEPYIGNNANIFIISLISIVSIIYLIYCKKNNCLNAKSLTLLIIIIGILIRNLYILKTSIYDRQHDVESLSSNGHLKYIYDLFNTGKLPTTNEWQFYHPPFFHLIGALWLKFNNIIGMALKESLEGLQILTVIFSSLTMIISYKIIDRLKIKDKYKLLLNAFMAFHPAFILLSGSINNDCLLVLLEFCIIYYLIKWYEKPSWYNIIILAIVTGLCVMTKLNGAIMAIPILYVFTKKFFETYKEDKQKIKKLIFQIIIFGLISLPIGLWYQIREFILFNGNNIPTPGDLLYIGNYSFFKRFFSISFDSISQIFCQPLSEYNIFAYIVKSSIFGEYTFDNLSFIHTLMVYTNFILIAFSTIYIIKYIFNKKEHNTLINILLSVWGINLLSFYIFNYNYPYICTMDFRYIVPTVFPGIILIGYNLNLKNNLINNFVKVCSILFIILCFIFIFTIE